VLVMEPRFASVLCQHDRLDCEIARRRSLSDGEILKYDCASGRAFYRLRADSHALVGPMSSRPRRRGGRAFVAFIVRYQLPFFCVA
jgi:hypothetical protein